MRNFALGMFFLLVAASCASCGVAKNKSYWSAIRAYEIAPRTETQPEENQVEWRMEKTLSNGIHVSLRATNWRGDSVIAVKYSDETQERVVCDFGDYIYPSGFRLEGNLMYAVVDGLAGGWHRSTALVVYDLAARKRVRLLGVDPKDLPKR